MRAPRVRINCPWPDLEIGSRFTIPYQPGWEPTLAQQRVVSTFCRWRRYKPFRQGAQIKTKQMGRGILVERVA